MGTKKSTKKLSASKDLRNRAVTLGALLAGYLPRSKNPINPYLVAKIVAELQDASAELNRRAKYERSFPTLTNEIHKINITALRKKETRINTRLRALFLNDEGITAPSVILTDERAWQIGAYLSIPEMRGENWSVEAGLWVY